MLVPIRDPEKNPSLAEKEALQTPPDLLQALEEAKTLLADPLSQATLISAVPDILIDPQVLLADDPLYRNGKQYYTAWQLEDVESQGSPDHMLNVKDRLIT
jgi:hypothetical protein